MFLLLCFLSIVLHFMDLVAWDHVIYAIW